VASEIKINLAERGDQNTKYFYSKAVWRAYKNKIQKLTDDDGVVHDNIATMQNMVNEYFQSIFTVDTSLDPSPVVNLVERCISDETNIRIFEEFSEKEISDALFQIGPLRLLTIVVS
jgi:hypothetical protein